MIAIVKTDQSGVTIRDDWAGFGQKLTGTGTTLFDGAQLDAEGLVPFENRFRYQTAFYQLVLNSVLTGAALAAVRVGQASAPIGTPRKASEMPWPPEAATSAP